MNIDKILLTIRNDNTNSIKVALQIDKGFDERLDIFYRVNLCSENSADDVNALFIDCYYRSIADLRRDLKDYIG